jgi:hypothetical protein
MRFDTHLDKDDNEQNYAAGEVASCAGELHSVIFPLSPCQLLIKPVQVVARQSSIQSPRLE